MDKNKYFKSFDAKRLTHQRYGEQRIMRGLREQIDTILEVLPQAGAAGLLSQLSEFNKIEPLQRAYQDLYGRVGGDFARSQFQRLTGKSKKAESDWIDYMRNFALYEAGTRITLVNDVTLNRIRQTLQQGIDQGLGIEKIARMMEQSNAVNRVRARVIARTEIISASNAGSDLGARSTGLNLRKEWLASIDGRERDAHRIANNEYQKTPIAMDESFIVGGEECMYPGDPNLSAGQVIQCRCTALYNPLENEQMGDISTPTSDPEPSINITDGVDAKYTDAEIEQMISELDALGIDYSLYDTSKLDGYMMMPSKYLTVQNALAQTQGFRGLPTQLSDDAFRVLANNQKDYMLTYRGISGSGANRHIDMFKNGELYGSSGNLYGNGTYLAGKSQYEVAKIFAGNIDDNVIPILVNKSKLKIIDFVKLQEMRDRERRIYQNKLVNTIKKKYGRTDIFSDEFQKLYPIESKKLQLKMTLYDDIGQFGTIKGYDAYSVNVPNSVGSVIGDLYKTTDYIVLLNRTKSIVPQSLRGKL